MKALHYLGPKQLAFADVAEPSVGDDDVLIKITKVGICGTDLHIYNGGMEVPTPLTIGHEFVGEVAKIGKHVTRVTVGDRVVAEHVIGCGQCRYCTQGRRNLCVKPTVIGLHLPGALAEFVSVPQDLVYRLPDDLDYDAGVLVEPLSIAVYAVRKAGVKLGNRVAVVGQGPIGLFVDQAAQAGGGVVYGFDIIDSRLAYAKDNHIVSGTSNTKSADYLDQFRSMAETDGADIVFECVGAQPTTNVALNLARPGAKVVILGVYSQDVSVNMMQVVKKELMVEGSWTCVFAFEPTIQLLKSGQISTKGLITHRYSFPDAVKAFEEASEYTDNRIKTVIEF